MAEAVVMDEEEEWRDEEEASSAVETGCCSSQSIPLFAHALSLLNSFPTPPRDDSTAALFSSVHNPNPDPQEIPSDLIRSILPAEACARNEEPNKTINSSSENNNAQKKIRSKNWTRLEMLKLIRLRTDYEPKFTGHGGKKMELWDEISEALNREGISRDGQQCRDKWEKLCANYKDVRDGTKMKEDFALFDVLHPVLSGKLGMPKKVQNPGNCLSDDGTLFEEEVIVNASENAPRAPSKKKRRVLKYVPVADAAVVQSLVESVVQRHQRFFKELLDSLERREQAREQARQEREEQWRAEDRAQRMAFSNAMIILVQRLLGEDKSGTTFAQEHNCKNNQENVLTTGKKRSKNWKRAEVLQLIKVRTEMETQFASGIRRAAVWDELAEVLMKQGIARDGKQCREKWDKLTAAYKEVTDGVKNGADMPYFVELSAALRRPVQSMELLPLDNGAV